MRDGGEIIVTNHVLLAGEASGVEGPFIAKGVELASVHNARPCLTKGIGQQLSDNVVDEDRRLTQTKQLIAESVLGQNVGSGDIPD